MSQTARVALHQPVRVELLGGFDVSRDGQRIPLPLSAQRVLALLALHDRPLLRAFVAGVLWLDSPEERAAASLRSVLWRLQLPGRDLVEAGRAHVGLAREVWVDVRDARAFARGVLSHDVERDNLMEWEARLGGDLLPHWYDDWVLMERERFRELRLHALESLCDQLLEVGDPAQAMEAALAAISADPLRESAHRALIRVHLSEGNHSDALRVYRRYRRLLQEELGVEPSEQLRGLLPTALPPE